MKRTLTAAVGLLLGGVLLALFLIFLSRQGLVKAGQWVTVVGFFVSAMLGLAGVILAYLTWKQQRRALTTANEPPQESVNRTGNVWQRNLGGVNLANSGLIGSPEVSEGLETRQSGDVDQENAGGFNVANSGVIADDIRIPAHEKEPGVKSN